VKRERSEVRTSAASMMVEGEKEKKRKEGK
jgi:hypothetical protein